MDGLLTKSAGGERCSEVELSKAVRDLRLSVVAGRERRVRSSTEARRSGR